MKDKRRKLIDLFNKITVNGMREMTLNRFIQAINDYDSINSAKKPQGNEVNTLLSTVPRPNTADEALKLLEQNITIEIASKHAFDLMRWVEQKKSNFKFTCKVNELNKGWTVIRHCR